MNILHTVFATGWGGLEKYPLTIKKGLEERGNKLIIVTVKGTKLHEEAEKQGIKVYTVEKFKKLDLSIVKLLKKIVVEEKIDIVHLNTSRELYNWYFVLRKYKKLKCFLTFHLGVPNHKGFIHKILYKKVTNVFAISTMEAEQMKNSLNIDNTKIKLLHNGVELEKFNHDIESDFREKLGVDNNEIIVTSIGNLSRPKGVLEWVEATKKIVEKYKNVTFIWVGDDSHINEEYTLDSLRKGLEEEGVGDKVKFLGYQTEITNILKASNLFLLPAHKESFGIVYIEAMAMGLPVIGCRSGGVPDIISPGNGWLCEPKSVSDLERVLVEVLNNKEKLESFKEVNQNAVKKFSMDKHISELVKTYKRSREFE